MQYVGIQTQQSRNNLRSAFLLFLFPCLVAALLYLSCYLLVLFGYGKSMEIEIMPMVNHFFLSSLPYTMGIVIIWFLIAYWANTSIINSATGSKPLDRIENKRVYNLVENLCMSQGMKMPKINIIYDSSLNAFASGINERTYTVTLSEGIIKKLNDEELEAVIAHELSHIRNRDVRLLIISIVFVGIFSMLTEIKPKYGRIFRLLYDGATQQEMADELGIKQRTVSDDIKKIRSLVQPLVKDIFNR